MTRLPMPSAMPVELAERLSDKADRHFSAFQRRNAREALIEEILEGEKRGGIDLEGLIDHELDHNRAMAVRMLYENLSGIGSLCRDDARARCQSIHEWLKPLVERAVDEKPDLIEERMEQWEGE